MADTSGSGDYRYVGCYICGPVRWTVKLRAFFEERKKNMCTYATASRSALCRPPSISRTVGRQGEWVGYEDAHTMTKAENNPAYLHSHLSRALRNIWHTSFRSIIRRSIDTRKARRKYVRTMSSLYFLCAGHFCTTDSRFSWYLVVTRNYHTLTIFWVRHID